MRTIAWGIVPMIGTSLVGCYASHEAGVAPTVEAPREASAVVRTELVGSSPSLSDDGRWLTYVHAEPDADGDGALELSMRLVDLHGDVESIVEAEGARTSLIVSGDGTTMLYSTDEGFVAIDRATGARSFEAAPLAGQPSLSDDGQRIGYQACRGRPGTAACAPQVHILDRRTHEVERFEGASPRYEVPHWVTLSGDGDRVVYEGSVAGEGGRMDTFLVRASTRTVVPLDAEGFYHRWSGISDDGRVIVTQRDAPDVWPEGHETDPIGLDLVVLTDGVWRDFSTTRGRTVRVSMATLSGDGSTVAFRTSAGLEEPVREGEHVWRLRLDEGAPELLEDQCDLYGPPALDDTGHVVVLPMLRCRDGSVGALPLLRVLEVT